MKPAHIAAKLWLGQKHECSDTTKGSYGKASVRIEGDSEQELLPMPLADNLLFV